MTYVSWTGFALAVAGGLGLSVSGPGYSLGLWRFQAGLGVAKYSAFLSLAAVVLCLFGLVLWITGFGPGGLVPSIIGLVEGGFVSIWMLKWKHNLDSVPYIHDITTDTDDPPLFEAVLPLRAGASNPAGYGGPDLALEQKKGYPDIMPGSLSHSPAETYPRALQAARDMGWEIVASDPRSLRIEATDTTAWFGFKDDVVVRLSPSPAGSRIDVRSVSRVGKSDVGTNARRIKAYLDRLR